MLLSLQGNWWSTETDILWTDVKAKEREHQEPVCCVCGCEDNEVLESLVGQSFHFYMHGEPRVKRYIHLIYFSNIDASLFMLVWSRSLVGYSSASQCIVCLELIGVGLLCWNAQQGSTSVWVMFAEFMKIEVEDHALLFSGGDHIVACKRLNTSLNFVAYLLLSQSPHKTDHACTDGANQMVLTFLVAFLSTCATCSPIDCHTCSLSLAELLFDENQWYCSTDNVAQPVCLNRCILVHAMGDPPLLT